MAINFYHRPNVIPWPPLVYLAIGVAGFGLHTIAPWRVVPASVGLLFGLGVMTVGVLLDFWAMFVMMRARTNVLPHRGAGMLVTWGPFALTRNPIYLGNTLAMIGLGIAFSGWFIILAVLAIVIIDLLAIRREEAHLAIRFGDGWHDYAHHVPRWIGIPARRG